MITDKGASFLSDLKRYETKHESYISLLNQLFDGKGDKMTLAKNVERPVPRNAIFPAFESFAKGCPLSIPVEIEAKYVQFAEEIINISYTQSEKFSSVGIFFITVMY